MTWWIRSVWSRMARTERSALSSACTPGRSCSARPAMTPRGVEISWAMPMAKVPRVAARSARSSRSSRRRWSAAMASSRSSSSSFRCRRRALPPNVRTSPPASTVASTRRSRARRSRSRSRSALATTATPHRPRAPPSIHARPATAVRRGSPSSAASGGGSRTARSPFAIASRMGWDESVRPSDAWSRLPDGGRSSTSRAPGRSRSPSPLARTARGSPSPSGLRREPRLDGGGDAPGERRLLLGEILQGRRRLAFLVPVGGASDGAHGGDHGQREPGHAKRAPARPRRRTPAGPPLHP